VRRYLTTSSGVVGQPSPMERNTTSEVFGVAPGVRLMTVGQRERRSRGLASPALAVLAGAILTVVAPYLLLVQAAVGETLNPCWPALACTTLAGLRFAWIVGSKQRHLFELVVWLFTYVFMALAPLVQSQSGYSINTLPALDTSYANEAYLVIFVGMLCLILGSWSASHRPYRQDRASSVMSPGRANVLSLAAICFATYFVVKVGLPSLFSSRFAFSDRLQEVWPDQATASLAAGLAEMTLLTAAVMQVEISRRAASTSRPHLVSAAFAVVLSALVLVVVNPLSSPRYVFGTVALSLAAAAGAYATLRRFRVVGITAIVGMVVVFPVLDSFRVTTTQGVKRVDIVAALTTGDFDAFGQVMNTLDYVDTHGITWGSQLLGVITFWVPRSLWPTKPVDTGILLAQYKGYSFTNLSASIWTEFFINGGWVLLVLGMFGVGYAARFADRRVERDLRVRPMPATLSAILAFYALIILRGSLLQAVASGTIVTLCVFACYKRRPSTQTRGVAMTSAVKPHAGALIGDPSREGQTT